MHPRRVKTPLQDCKQLREKLIKEINEKKEKELETGTQSEVAESQKDKASKKRINESDDEDSFTKKTKAISDNFKNE